MTPEECASWRPIIEGMAAGVAAAVAGVTGTEEGRAPLGIGAGGDRTRVLDQVAEDTVVTACEALHRGGASFLLRSEELGDRRFGADLPILIVDPVDGSRNAMTGLPYFSTALALLDGGALGDAVVGVVRSLAGPGTFSAVLGQGAWYDGRPLAPLGVALGAHDRIALLALEAHRSFGHGGEHAGADLGPVLRASGRVRMLGSSALTLCHTAAGAISALIAPDGMRAHDCAAGLLVLREAGGVATTLEGGSLDGVPALVGVASPLVASLSREVHAHVLALLAEGNRSS